MTEKHNMRVVSRLELHMLGEKTVEFLGNVLGKQYPAEKFPCWIDKETFVVDMSCVLYENIVTSVKLGVSKVCFDKADVYMKPKKLCGLLLLPLDVIEEANNRIIWKELLGIYKKDMFGLKMCDRDIFVADKIGGTIKDMLTDSQIKSWFLGEADVRFRKFNVMSKDNPSKFITKYLKGIKKEQLPLKICMTANGRVMFNKTDFSTPFHTYGFFLGENFRIHGYRV
jgi:hypothetical protein